MDAGRGEITGQGHTARKQEIVQPGLDSRQSSHAASGLAASRSLSPETPRGA